MNGAMHPQLLRHDANLPPNVSRESAFAYQTDTPPYHFDMSTAYQNLYRNDMQSCCVCDDEDSVFDVTDSDADYETNINLRPSNNDRIHNSYNNSHVNNADNTDNTDNTNNTNTCQENHYNCCRNEDAINTLNTSPKLDMNSHTQSNGQSQDSSKLSPCVNVDSTDNSRLINSNNSINSPSSYCPCDYISNEGQESNSDEDFFENFNIADDLDDTRQRVACQSYQLTDEGMSSDENEQENSESETNANDWVFCEEMDL